MKKAELNKLISDGMVITFLQDNEQYGDDWSDAIAELYKVIDAIEGLMK